MSKLAYRHWLADRLAHSSKHAHKLEVLGFQLSIYNFDNPLRPGSLAYYGYTLANHLVKKKVLTPEIAPDIP